MKTNQHTAAQIIKILEQAKRGEQPIAVICCEHGIAENSFYRQSQARPPSLEASQVAGQAG